MKTLTFPEVPGLCLERAFNDGLVSGHYGSRLAGAKIRSIRAEIRNKQKEIKALQAELKKLAKFP